LITYFRVGVFRAVRETKCLGAFCKK